MNFLFEQKSVNAMETMKKPQLETHREGKSLKVLRVTGKMGIHMPEHHSTQEVVIVAQCGSAVLCVDGKELNLSQGDVIVIPAGTTHSLTAKNSFQALAIMNVESSIIFEK
jgi:quercetin dioxygenase-like cupin family protein